MLVVTRKKGQSIIIVQGNIEITVLEIKNGKVKLGVNAPENTKILRKEIVDQTKSVNRDAKVDSSGFDLKMLQQISVRKKQQSD